MLTAEKHPQADKLQVLSVDAGTGEAIQVVCGAPNARAGMVGVFGPPGTYIPGSDITLKVAAIRGVESRGMMCSSRELELGDDHSGIIELPDDAPVGTPFTQYAGLDDPRVRRERYAQPARLLRSERNRARSRRRRDRPGDTQRRPLRRHRGRLPVPGPDPDRGRLGLPGLLGPRDPRRPQWAEPGMAAAAAEGGRA